ncbi:hypothetical protein HRI_003125000 [Hibiscus trionum]|uniref:Uncharacterized protein n=1 Tax=Hibiscus trionum TaxID=183268 RepID=A0A9W7IG98_HIBTR|nr:hypothetical protein HRI_003125000 [Hibiscus trionum]
MSPTATPNGRSSRVFSESDEIQILKCLIRDTKSISPPITTVDCEHARNKSLVRTHHDRRIFKISKRIWGKKTIPRKKKNEMGDGVENLATEFSRVLPENEVWKEKMMALMKMDQEWGFLKVEEAKLVAKKAELIHQQIMKVIRETGSANGV